MTTVTFEAKKAITEVYESLTNIFNIENKRSLVIAGGAVSDNYFGKPAKDVDVFLSDKYLDEEALKAYGFESAEQETTKKHRRDSYGEVYVEEKLVNGSVTHVMKGEVSGYPVDLVFINKVDIPKYISKKFDVSIKHAYYDGQFRYMKPFKETIKTGEVFPVSPQPGEFLRAWFSAEKYGLKLADSYQLSKDLCARAWKTDKLDSIVSDKMLNMVTESDGVMFDDNYNKDNSNIGSLFMTHGKGKTNLWEKLRDIASKDKLVNHVLEDVSIDVSIDSDETNRFVSLARFMENIAEEGSKVETWSRLLASLTPEQFRNGMMVDDSGREARIGRFLAKYLREAVKAYEGNGVTVHEMQHIFEKRGVTAKEVLYFTSSKSALLNISTKTAWSSCQRMGGFLSNTGQNYGLLANLSGNTLVAYTSYDKERADDDSSKWSSRSLVRIGEDGSMIVEKTYSNLTHLTHAFGDLISDKLVELGFTAHKTRESARHFKSLPYLCEPYGDTPYVSVHEVGKVFVQKGRHEQIILEEMEESLKNLLIEFRSDQALMEFTVEYSGAFCELTFSDEINAAWKALLDYRTSINQTRMYFHVNLGSSAGHTFSYCDIGKEIKLHIGFRYPVRSFDTNFLQFAITELHEMHEEEQRAQALVDPFATVANDNDDLPWVL